MNAIIFFSLTGLIPAQSPSPLQVDHAIFDRGDVKSGVALKQRFELRSHGSVPVTIREVAVGCGCLKPQLSRTEVPPGEAVELIIDVNTLSQPAGANQWKTTVRYVHGSD